MRSASRSFGSGMTTVGIIGAGNIGQALAQGFVDHGYDVVIANSRGPETLADFVGTLGERARAGAVRQTAPYGQLTINNALIRTAIFRQFPLDERLTGYGHEDTKFGVELAAAHVSVLHLDNPVLHNGLEPAAVFLQKSEQAVHNLAQVYQQDGLGTDSRLLQTALRLRRLGLAPAARAALTAVAPALRRQLLSAAPLLRGLDLLKLQWLLRELA